MTQVRPSRAVYAINDHMLNAWKQERRPQPSRLLVRTQDEADAVFGPYKIDYKIEGSIPVDRIQFRWGELEIVPCPDVAEGVAVLVSGNNPPVEIPLS